MREGDNYFIEDLGSSNGTYLNGQPVSGPVSLQSGDEIALGHTVVMRFDLPTQSEIPTKESQSGAPEPEMTMLEGDEAPYQTMEVMDDDGLTMAAESAPPEPAPPQPTASRPPRDAMQTMLGGEELYTPDLDATPPEFTVAVAGVNPQTYTLSGNVITIGRSDDNDIVIGSRIVSRHHARLERSNGGYRLVVLPDASNPVLYKGRPVEGALQLSHEDKLRIGGLDPGIMVTMTYSSPAEATAEAGAIDVTFGEQTVLTIGRDASNDIVLDSPTVSRYHAQLERVGQRYRVTDLRSSNGTFVNDQQIEGETWLKPNDSIRIGSYKFVMGHDQLARYDETGGLKVEAHGLNKWVRKDLNILQDISVTFQPREFIVVVGQSGGGKSTLVDAIAGYRPATHGRVFVNGIDVYRNFNAIRNDIGYVPQKDIIHMELTVFQALDYAAQLRMPPDTTKEERHRRVMEVLDDLDLAHRKDVQISGLSGGQQKRVSIGVELLTKPGLFFLDEPTSGLDPGTETALMQLMRRLADQGRTIVLITHATKNVMLADKVIFLARGGYMAWFGPPEEALEYFDQYRSERERRSRQIEFDEIYAILEDSSKGSPQDWAERFRATQAYQQYVLAQTPEGVGVQAPQVVAPGAGESGRKRQVSSLRQFFILSSRNIKILTRDRFSLILMLAAAPVLALIDFVLAAVLGRSPFAFEGGSVFSVMIMLFLMGVYGVMIGALAMMREIVKEADIYRRERLVNLKILPYVLSKIWVAALLALYQAGAYVLIRYVAFDMPGGTSEFIFIYITMALAAMAGMMLGLFASALAPNPNSAPLIVIILALPQIVLGGALIPLTGTANLITIPMSTRWAYEGLMAITGIGSDVAADQCWALPRAARKALTLEQKEEQGCNCLGLAMLKQENCNFPGLAQFYDPLIDQPPPQEPPPLREEPAEPTIPPQPEKPQDESDQVAMAEYFDALEAWQDEATRIQDEYRAEVNTYRAEADVYQAEQVAYQTALADWQVARAGAVQPAEALVDQIHRDMGWTFVNKRDTTAYISKVVGTWIAQGVIISILFVAILILQKRKDATS
jgi:ABC-type multidrug transport system ATPase subunit/pSer/pThr/pTyr-binding forkhead associated (FHA) protein